jgi:hypothetical protein
MIRSFSKYVYILPLAFAAGCDSGPVERTVEGTVTYASKSLDHGMIMFQPSKGRLASAPLQSDGKYSISLTLGEYSVFLNAPPKLPDGFKESDPLPPNPNPLPSKYSQKETSGLSVTVEAGAGSQTFAVSLQ